MFIEGVLRRRAPNPTYTQIFLDALFLTQTCFSISARALCKIRKTQEKTIFYTQTRASNNNVLDITRGKLEAEQGKMP